MQDPGRVMQAALEGDEAQVGRLLGRLRDEDLEAYYKAWRLVGWGLSKEMVRRTVLEDATFIAQTT